MSLYLLYLLLGAAAGLVAGLLGVGGGLIVVPALVIGFTIQGVSAGVLTHLAVGTSLATIVVTSVSSMRSHHKRGAVDWDVFRALAPGIALGAWLGASLAALLSGPALQTTIGVILFCIALQMGFGREPAAHRALPGPAGLLAAGASIGGVSAVCGIGGGSLTVPFLRWCNTDMRRAVGTSAACGLPIALVGAATNVAQGWDEPGLPEHALGFVYLPAFLGIVLASTPMARAGARLAHRLPPRTLQRIFAGFLFAVSVKFLFFG